MIPTNPAGWAAALCLGTVLSFRFPLGEGEGRSKARPCLVIGVASQDDEAPRVTIAYGTSATSHANRGLDLHLPEPNDWQAAGLRRPSRFVLSRRVTVPADDVGFDLHRRRTPLIGMLPSSAMAVLDRLTGRLGSTITDDRRRGAAPRKRSENRARREQHPCRGRQAPIIIRVRRKPYDRPSRMAAKLGVRPQPRVSARGRT